MITCIPSLVASNMHPISMAVFKVKFLLFSRQRCLTWSSRDLQAIALRITLTVSVISRPLAKSLRSVTLSYQMSLPVVAAVDQI